MHNTSRSHLRLVGNPEASDSVDEGDDNDHDHGHVSALKALADATSAEEAFGALQSWNQSAAAQQADAYDVEQELYRGGMEVMRFMLEENFRSRGLGDVGPCIETKPREQELEGQEPEEHASEEYEPGRLGQRRQHGRNYESLFGTIRIERLGYGARGQQSIHPLDEELNLPGRKYSHVLQERGARRCGRGPFDEALDELETTSAGHIPKRQLEQVVVDAAQDFSAFYEERARAAPPPAESGSIITCGIDCKGVPKRKTEAERAAPRKIRLGKGEKRTKKKMATVASVHTTEPYHRTAEQVVANLMDPDAPKPETPRPRPEGRRAWASLKQSKDEVIKEVAKEMQRRDPDGDKTAVCVMDGEKALKRRALKYLRQEFPALILVLDIIHVVEYLWKAAYAFHEPESEEARRWVRERLLRILNGEVSLVARGMRQSATKQALSPQEREVVDTACNYFLNNKDRMRYDEYLALGLPIASGSAEGACGHLVKDRMEITGATWNVHEDGAEAVLRIRALDKSGDWDEYWKFHMEQERKRLYATPWKVAA
jgi:hypothetical protein